MTSTNVIYRLSEIKIEVVSHISTDETPTTKNMWEPLPEPVALEIENYRDICIYSITWPTNVLDKFIVKDPDTYLMLLWYRKDRDTPDVLLLDILGPIAWERSSLEPHVVRNVVYRCITKSDITPWQRILAELSQIAEMELD